MKKSFLFVLVLLCSMTGFCQEKADENLKKLNSIRTGISTHYSKNDHSKDLELSSIYVGYSRDIQMSSFSAIRLCGDLRTVGTIEDLAFNVPILGGGVSYVYGTGKLKGEVGVNYQRLTNYQNNIFNFVIGGSYCFYKNFAIDFLINRPMTRISGGGLKRLWFNESQKKEKFFELGLRYYF